MRRSSRVRRRRERGLVANLIVIATGISLAGVVIAAAGTTNSFAREEARLVASDEALALAESGVLYAKAKVAESKHWGDRFWSGQVEIGRGRFEVNVETADGGDFVVTSTGTVVASVLGARPAPVIRRVRARLRHGTVVEWKEL